MPEPNPQLLASLGRLVRGLSALFWGLPIALIVCVQTAKGDWLRPLGVLPALVSSGLLLYGLTLLGAFQKQERVWIAALDRARLLALINIGLAPFLYWHNRAPMVEFFANIVVLMGLSGMAFLFLLNPVLWRLTAMLPDETLRLETRLFTTVNRVVIVVTLALGVGYVWLLHQPSLPPGLLNAVALFDRVALWLGLFLLLLPIAMTMALVWKTKEVILASVFGTEP